MNKKIQHIYSFFLNKFKNTPDETTFDFEELTVKVPAVYPFSSILEAMEIINSEKVSAIPVVSINNDVIGIITERDIVHLIALQSIVGWAALRNYSVDSVFLGVTNLKTKSATLEEIAVEFTGRNVEIVPIVDENNNYSGYCITASKLIYYTINSIKPKSIGGLATPLGVYLTDGFYNAGAGNLGLVLTGVVFSIILTSLTILLSLFLTPYKVSQSLMLIIQLASFLIILRLTPLSSYHAAEHQTIHAIEKGLELTLENVKSQPKEHNRCGTNLMILFLGLSLLFMVSTDYWTGLGIVTHTSLLILFSAIIILSWKKVGMSLQRFFTTSKASDKQLLSGIKAGQELLDYYKNNTHPIKVTIFHKIWNIGILQVLVSFMAVSSIVLAIVSYLYPIQLVYATILLTNINDWKSILCIF